jgi:hypothetical protein
MIIIDGVTYNLPIISLTRKADFLDRYAQRTLDGKLHRKLIGVYFNYTLKFGSPHTSAQLTTYRALWDKLSEATEYHTVTVPDESTTPYTFTAYFANVGDEMRREASVNYWKNLTVNFIAQQPAATP